MLAPTAPRATQASPLQRQGVHPVHPERDADLAGVVDVVLDEVPDDPPAVEGGGGALLFFFVGLIPLGRGPAREGLLHIAPRRLQPLSQLGRGPRRRIRAVPGRERPQLLATL